MSDAQYKNHKRHLKRAALAECDAHWSQCVLYVCMDLIMERDFGFGLSTSVLANRRYLHAVLSTWEPSVDGQERVDAAVLELVRATLAEVEGESND